MSLKVIPTKEDIEDDFCVILGLGRTIIGSWRQANIVIL